MRDRYTFSEARVCTYDLAFDSPFAHRYHYMRHIPACIMILDYLEAAKRIMTVTREVIVPLNVHLERERMREQNKRTRGRGGRHREKERETEIMLTR